jgi:putative ABC transport system permease protein
MGLFWNKISKDNLLFSFRNIKERRARSILTIVGIAIGIAAIVSLMGLGQGMEESVTGQLSMMADMITVMPGGYQYGQHGEVEPFTEEDIRDIEHIDGVEAVAPMISGQGIVEYRGERIPIPVQGVDERMEEVMHIEEFEGIVEIEEGRDLKWNDRGKCVLGNRVAKRYFEDEIGVNDRISINGENLRVIGIYGPAGGGLYGSVDTTINLPMRDAEDILEKEGYTMLQVRIADIDMGEEIAKEIEETINDNHNLEFAFALPMTSSIEQLKGLFSMISGVLIGIAAIALLVAAIGIINTMLMSVMERTHEIGVMKAIGAKSSDILSLFLIETGMISIIGGVSGCIIGIFGAYVICAMISMMAGMDISPIITLNSIIIGLIVAIGVGILSGLYPARRASKMSPLEALRYE